MATTLLQLLDEYVYTQLQDADLKHRWTRDELTEYANLAVRDLILRRPEAGVTVDEGYELTPGARQALAANIIRLKEVVANTGVSALVFTGAVRADGYTIDLVFNAVEITPTTPVAAFTVDVGGNDNNVLTAVASGAVLTLTVTNPIYADAVVTVSFDDNFGNIADTAGRDLLDQVDVPVENGSDLVLIRYAVATHVEARATTRVTRNGVVVACSATPLAAVTRNALVTTAETRALVAPSPTAIVVETEVRAAAVVPSNATLTAAEARTVLAGDTEAVTTAVNATAAANVTPTAVVTGVHVYAILINAA